MTGKAGPAAGAGQSGHPWGQRGRTYPHGTYLLFDLVTWPGIIPTCGSPDLARAPAHPLHPTAGSLPKTRCWTNTRTPTHPAPISPVSQLHLCAEEQPFQLKSTK